MPNITQQNPKLEKIKPLKMLDFQGLEFWKIRLGNRCSILLSYRRTFWIFNDLGDTKDTTSRLVVSIWCPSLRRATACRWRIPKFGTISSAFENMVPRPSDSSRYCESIGRKKWARCQMRSRPDNTTHGCGASLLGHSSARNFSGRGWCLIESATMALPPI